MIEPDEDDDWWKRGPARGEDLDNEEDADDETAIPCPHCGEDVFDDAEQCPTCGTSLIRDRRALTGRPNWFVVLGFVGALFAIVTWIVLRR
jgi:predicted RNA-binding Zn-ribbon protein involved in translation (DUF1610 family)